MCNVPSNVTAHSPEHGPTEQAHDKLAPRHKSVRIEVPFHVCRTLVQKAFLTLENKISLFSQFK